MNTPHVQTTRRHPLALLALAAAVVVLLLSACGDSGSEPLDGTTWTPTEIGGVAVVSGGGVFVSFAADAQLNGSTGCNSFTGEWSTDGDDGGIEILPGGMTLAACATEEMQAQETAFLGALSAASFYERDGSSLSLLDGDKNQLADLDEVDAGE